MTIRKSGYMDSARSHVLGLLPYVLPNHQIHYIENDENSGNFGQYVCDFGKNGDSPGRKAGEDSVNNYSRFRYQDFNRSYAYAKKQVRVGILVKYLGRHEVKVRLKCDGSPEMAEKDVWSYKFEENPEPYDYIPFNYYGKDENGHRTIENYAKEGDYGLIFTNGNTEDRPDVKEGGFALLVGASMDENGTIYPNQEKVYKRVDENVSGSVYWEYPDTAGKIKSDSTKWIGFGVNFSTDENWAVCRDMEEKFIGYLNIPQTIEGNLVPDRIAYADIPEWIDWFNKHSKDSCCYEKIMDGDEANVGNIVDKEWTDRGGDDMKNFLEAKGNKLEQALEEIKGMKCTFLVPNMVFPLLLTNEYKDTGLWTEYVDENGGAINDPAEVESLKAEWVNLEDKELKIESQLQCVRSDVYHSDDNGVLPGLLDEDGGYYRCTYQDHWEYNEYPKPTDDEKENAKEVYSIPEKSTSKFDDTIIKISDGNGDWIYYKSVQKNIPKIEAIGAPAECYDDHTAANEDSCYFAATVVEEAVPILYNLVPLKENRNLIDGDYIQILAKFKSPLKIPYIKNEVHNFYDDGNGNYYGDYVTDIQKTGSEITIDYLIGGKCNEDGKRAENSDCGILLRDTYYYEPSHEYNSCFEGYPATIIGEYLDFDNSPNTKEVDNYDWGTTETDENGEDTFVPKTRKCNQAQVLGMRLMDALDGLMPKVMLKQPETDGIDFPIKSDVDIELNRGASAAFESYFKLSECNTMQDLENYQNNWFNL